MAMSRTKRIVAICSVVARYSWLMWLSLLSVFRDKLELAMVQHTFSSFMIANFAMADVWDQSFADNSLSVLHAAIVLASGAWILSYQAITHGVWRMFDCKALVNEAWPHAYSMICFSCGFMMHYQESSLRHLFQHGLDSGLVPTLVYHCLQIIGFTIPLYGDVMVNSSLLVLVSFAVWELCRRIKVEFNLRLRPVEEFEQYRIPEEQNLV